MRCETVQRHLRKLTRLPVKALSLVTGPTGSGKTTTLYKRSFQRSNAAEINIMTIEETRSNIAPGIAQMGVNARN